MWTLGSLIESVYRYLLLTERDEGWKICPLKGSSGSTVAEVEWEDGPYTSPATGLRVRLWYILKDNKEHLVLTGNAEKNQKNAFLILLHYLIMTIHKIKRFLLKH